MSLTLVNLVKREVEKSTHSLIRAESELAGMRVRYEWEQKKVDDLLTWGNCYSDQVEHSKSACELYKKELEEWSEIQDFVVETFINNA